LDGGLTVRNGILAHLRTNCFVILNYFNHYFTNLLNKCYMQMTSFLLM